MKFFTNKIRYSILAGLAACGTSILVVSMLAMTTVVPNVQAEDKDTLEELVDRYAEIAEKNVNAMKTRDNLQQDLDDELKKSIPDIAIIEDLQKVIDEQYVIMKNTAMELASIQAKVTEGSQMDPEFKQILKNARDILYENQEIIPWTGLGVSNSEQAVTISIDAENPEDYRMIIENLVGKDIPVVIKKGGNPFVKDTVIISPSQQFKAGIAIDEIKCKESLTLITRYDGSPACVKPESIPELIERGWANGAKIENEWTTSYFPNKRSLPNGTFDTNLENVVPWLMMQELEQHGIKNWKNDLSTGPHTDEGWHNPSKMCSSLFVDVKTKLYISSTFYSEPELFISEIIIDDSRPTDCQKWFTVPYGVDSKTGYLLYDYNEK